MNNSWQPWSLRELAGELADGATTPAEALARSQARIAATEPDVLAWVVRDPTPVAVPGPLASLLRTGADIPVREYEAARRTVAEVGARVAELLSSYDAVLGPATPGPAPEGLASTGDPVLSRPWQALGLPVVTVPGPRSAAGLPFGLQLVGRVREETALLTTGCWVEECA
jgi:Asp-tRNA(Asn)/Glu-tRNA(Gln) amidotransferase A subunit family amidase